MKILLIEDDDFKGAQIARFLSFVAPKSNVAHVRSVKAAEARIFKEEFDLVFVDMSLPTFDIHPSESGGRPQGFGGREIIDFLVFRRSEAKVVVITQFRRFNDESGAIDLEDLSEELELRYSDRLLDIVFFEAGSEEWQKKIRRVFENWGGVCD